MKTKNINLYYAVTPDSIIPPDKIDIARKNRWIADVQREATTDTPVMIKTTYEIFNPDVFNQLRFINGTCVLYYAIQDLDLYDTLPDSRTLKLYREELMDELLGYEVKLISKTIRKRKSLTQFKSTQKMSRVITKLQETIFDPAGYEFPDSEEFWKLVKEHGYAEAQRISISNLQKIIRSKYELPKNI